MIIFAVIGSIISCFIDEVENIDIKPIYSIHRIIPFRCSCLDLYRGWGRVLMRLFCSFWAFLLYLSTNPLKTTPLTKGIISHLYWYHSLQIKRKFLSWWFPMILFFLLFFLSLASSAVFTSLTNFIYLASLSWYLFWVWHEPILIRNIR